MKPTPEIRQVHTLSRSRLFEVQAVDLTFSNGAEAQFERVVSTHSGAVCVVPITDNKEVLLIREYGVGVERYELQLPKGKLEAGEDILDGANREIREEVGHRAEHLSLLKTIAVSPGYLSHQTHLVLATGLVPDRCEGDEPEPLEVVPWPMADLDALFAREDVTEARSMIALYLAKTQLEKDGWSF